MPNTPSRILGPNGRPLRAAPPRDSGRSVRARYDSAQTTEENKNHWSNADAFSALAANSIQVRRTLRNRARFEVANNGYAAGMVETLANDTIGTGPRLQVQTDDADVNRRVSEAFEEWVCAVGLAEKLRTMYMAKVTDGESFALVATNPALDTPVQLDLHVVEADQVATPYAFLPNPKSVDGIEFDDHGNPAYYHVLREHPGDLLHWGEFGAFDREPARYVLHWFKVRRPGQRRGVPEIMAALPLFAQLRRYTLATLSAAEMAALFAVMLKSNLAPEMDDQGGQIDGIPAFDKQEVVRGMMTALPDGYEAQQMKPEHPTTTYSQFKAELINEIARPLNMPYNVAAGNSKEYNYSSGRLDHQVYHRSVGVERYTIATRTLDRVFGLWLAEARLADPASVEGLDAKRLPRRNWRWDGFQHVDPEKEANGTALRLANGTTSLDMECADDGNDWREVTRQRAEERDLCLELGLPYPGDPKPSAPPGQAPNPNPNANPNPAAEASMSGRTRIVAAAEPATLSLASAPVEFQAAAGDGKRPTFDIVGYTGAPMNVEGFYLPVVLDLAGLRAASQTIPALRDHDTGRIVGQTSAVKVASDVRFEGTVTGDNADAHEVVSQSKNGFRWQASVGASIDRREVLEAGKKATVNGREVTGPMLIARESTVKEISFVALGADGQTSAAVAASLSLGSNTGAIAMNFEAWLQAKGYSDPAAVPEALKTALRAAYHVEHPPAAPASASAPAPAATSVVTAAANPGTQADPATVSSLSDIFTEQRRVNEQAAEITRITAQALRERPGMADTLERLSRTAIEARMDPLKYELEILRLTRATATATFAVHTQADTRASSATIEAALCKAGGLDGREKHFDERTLQAADDRFKNGLGLCSIIHIAARENGWNGHSVKDDPKGALRAAMPLDVRADGFSTLSLPNILSNVANKFLAAGFNAVESTWRDVAARRSANDFKQISTMSLTGGMMYEEVGPSGELKHATAGELVYTNQVKDYGRLFAVTRRDIVNDDLGALTAVPRKLGRGAALKLNDVFWTVFLNNSTFFASGNSNYISGAGTVLSLASLDQANSTFANQTDPDGFPVAISPAILLVPNALNVAANNFMNSTTVVNNTTANTTTLGNNPFAGMFKVVRSSYLSNSSYTGYSTTAWYLLASPDDLPVIEVAFLNGRETPIVESADAEFDTLGIQFRGYLDFGVGLQEYRAGVKSAGA